MKKINPIRRGKSPAQILREKNEKLKLSEHIIRTWIKKGIIK